MEDAAMIFHFNGDNMEDRGGLGRPLGGSFFPLNGDNMEDASGRTATATSATSPQ